MPLSPGQVLNNRYRIVTLLGQGGFGAVYRAWDLTLKIPCAIKENLEQSDFAQQQFAREATILANLHHNSLPRVYDHFTIQGLGQYLVMDYVEGKDLNTLRTEAGGQLPEAHVVGWIGQICDAVDYMHRQSPPIIHRDIKPANIIVRPDGTAMLVDFGIAKVFQAGSKTTRGARGVTPGCSPPEQYGQGTTDARTDIYALGATAYMLLSGQDPPESIELLRNTATLISLRSLNPRVSAYAAQAIHRAMQLDPARRFNSAAELKTALTTPTAKLPPPPEGTHPFPWKWVVIGIGLVLVVGLVLGVGGYALYTLGKGDGVPIAGANPTHTSPANEPSHTPRSQPQNTDTPPPTLPPASPTRSTAGDATLPPTALSFTQTPWPTSTSLPTSTRLPTATTNAPISLAYVRGIVGNTDIYISNASGGNIWCIACNPCDESDPAWSPDEQWVIYQSNCAGSYDIWKASTIDGSQFPLTNTSDLDEREPHWSPDGRQIVFQRHLVDENRNTPGELFTMDTNGGNIRSLSILGRQPVFSPDGSYLAYMSDVSGLWQIFVRSLGDGNTRQITSCTTNCRWPDWSPTSQYVTYNTTVSAGSTDPNGIEYIPVAGGTPTVLINDQACGRPSWSSSGWIAFNSDQGIEVIRPDGSGRQLLIPFVDAYGPVWSR